MPVLGLVLRVDSRSEDLDRLRQRIDADPRLERGEEAAGCWPLVACLSDEGDTVDDCRALHEELRRWPGVAEVEVVFTEVLAPSPVAPSPEPSRTHEELP